MQTGRQGDYDWLERGRLSVSEVLTLFPDLVLGKYVIVTASGGRPPVLTREAFDAGWLQYGRLAINPCVDLLRGAPCEGPSEWYVFSKTPLLEPFKIFVNDPGFTLADSDDALNGPAVDQTITPSGNDLTSALRELFWMQVELKLVETYIASPNGLTIATRRPHLFSTITQAVSTVSINF
jgi:hypothetical protein